MTSPVLAVLVIGALVTGVTGAQAENSQRIERAWSSWVTIGGTKVVTEGLRVTDPGGEVTYGRISRAHCHSIHDCVGSSVARRIPSESFQLAADLSDGRLSFSVRGKRATTTWHAARSLPDPRAGTRQAKLVRDARATGQLYGSSLDRFELRKARMVGGAGIVHQPLVAPAPKPPFVQGVYSATSCWSYRRAERRFATSHNDIRVAQGQSRLKLDADLSRVARAHTRAMVTKDLLHHSSTLQLTNRVKGWIILGENVGVGHTPESLMDAFMASPAHRANILHASYRYFGVGTKIANGRLWVTVIFEATDNPSTSLKMPSCT